MRQFTIAAAIAAIAGLFSVTPGSAENIGGGPIQQNGKCWHGNKHSSPSDANWGYWESCAERASRSGAGVGEANTRRRT